jgi:hypothetical protein
MKRPEMSMELILVTPQQADYWLENALKERQRKYKPLLAAKYCREMRGGAWYATHQAIAFDEYKNLIDGQHRLHAIVESGISVWCWICRNVKMEACIAIDQHSKRSPADCLSIQRGKKIDNGMVATASAMLSSLVQHRWNQGGGYTANDIGIVFDHYSDGILYAMEKFTQKTRKICCAPVRAAVARAYYTEFECVTNEKLSSFCELFVEGLPINNNNQERMVIHFRNLILIDPRYNSCGGGAERMEIMFTTERIIKAFCCGEYLSRIVRHNTPTYSLPLSEEVLNLMNRGPASESAREMSCHG